MSNPYQPPQSQQEESLIPIEIPLAYKDSVHLDQNDTERRPAVSLAGTTMPRHMAAILDNVLAAILGVLLAKQLPEE